MNILIKENDIEKCKKIVNFIAKRSSNMKIYRDGV